MTLEDNLELRLEESNKKLKENKNIILNNYESLNSYININNLNIELSLKKENGEYTSWIYVKKIMTLDHLYNNFKIINKKDSKYKIGLKFKFNLLNIIEEISENTKKTEKEELNKSELNKYLGIALFNKYKLSMHIKEEVNPTIYLLRSIDTFVEGLEQNSKNYILYSYLGSCYNCLFNITKDELYASSAIDCYKKYLSNDKNKTSHLSLKIIKENIKKLEEGIN